MQIVIDIDSYVLEHCKRHVKEHYANNIEEAIANGVLLPKGHGRIADIDEAIKCIEEVKGKDAIYAISLIEWACGKRTIIKADSPKRGKSTPLEENDSGYNCENWIP